MLLAFCVYWNSDAADFSKFFKFSKLEFVICSDYITFLWSFAGFFW